MSAKPSHIIISLFTLFLIATPPAMAAVITVNTAADVVSVGNGVCSLREAVNNVNSVGVDTTGGDCATSAGGDTISLPAGTCALTGASGEAQYAYGELCITKAVTIQGANAATTTIIVAGKTDGKGCDPALGTAVSP